MIISHAIEKSKAIKGEKKNGGENYNFKKVG